jgi:hypothetical protein
VDSEEYQSQLSDERFSKLTNNFLCEAIVAEKNEKVMDQFWALISAAWSSDDAGNRQGASFCRENAARLAMQAREDGISYASDPDSEVALLVDLLRRSDQFERARAVILATDSVIANDVVKTILRYQTKLMEAKDLSCHTIEEAMRDQ